MAASDEEKKSAAIGGSSNEAAKPSVSYADQIAQQQQLAKTGQLEGALQNLLALEKTARLVRATALRVPALSCSVPHQSCPPAPLRVGTSAARRSS